MSDKHQLTGNDIALATNAVSLALAWWKEQPASGFKREQMAKLSALSLRLQHISMYAYPYEWGDDMPLDFGDEPIVRLDDDVVKATRAAALSPPALETT